MTTPAIEVNFDGLVGPTHNYAGLSFGNVASQKHKRLVSRPREAALQGLAKMKFLAGLGVRQAVLPPQERPDVATLRRLGFDGTDGAVLARAARESPRLLAACGSASMMWAANAATVSPSADAGDGRVHFTPANLVSQFHRSLEPPATAAILRAIFPEGSAFAHHDPLPAADALADEGAANQMRLCAAHGGPGVEVFVHGRGGFDGAADGPARFPARQTLEAQRAIARLHRLDPRATFFLRQNPAAIDAGVFHNDVAAVANANVLLYHESAYVDADAAIERIRAAFAERCGGPLHVIRAGAEEISLGDAVETYLFNSQVVSLPDGSMSLIAPVECREHPAAQRFIARVVGSGNPIRSVHHLDVRQSMRNGGGPACLRLRVVLTERELAGVHPGIFLTDALHAKLVGWVARHYREQLAADDLADPALLRESRAALDELTGLLDLGSVYPFQRGR